MRGRRRVLAALALAAPLAARATVIVDPGDSRCLSMPGSFPPGVDWIAGAEGQALAVTFEPAVAVPVDFSATPPDPGPGPFSDLRSAIAAAACGGSRDPQLDGVHAPTGELAFLTASSCESLAFVDPVNGGLRSLTVSTPAAIAAGTFPYNPAPGASQSRVAISTRACVVPPAPALDSRGDPVANGCRAGQPSYYTNFTSGAARIGDRLLVTTSNLGSGAGTANAQFLPGTVLAFDLDESGAKPVIAPHPTTPVLFTAGFNPTHVTAHVTQAGRALALVGVSGALGLVPDDPRTPEREAGGEPLSEAAIDVVDVGQLRVIATIPLGLAALSFERLGVDPGGRVAVIGSAVARHLFAVDLAPLDGLAPDAPWQLVDAAIFDAESPFELPALPDGAPPDTCPGFVVGAEFAADGRRVYATDFCDGTLTVVAARLPGSRSTPIAPDRFGVEATLELVAPIGPDSLGLPQALGALRVRPALEPDGPELAFLVGYPEGLLCGVTVPAPEPGAALGSHACLCALAALAARRGRRADGATSTGRIVG